MAEAGAEEPAADATQFDKVTLSEEPHPENGAAGAARRGNTGANGDPVPKQLGSGATRSRSAATGDWAAEDEAAAPGLLPATPWRVLNTDDEMDVVTLWAILSEVAAARLEPHLSRLQVSMC